MRIINLAAGNRWAHVWTSVFLAELRKRGELTAVENASQLPDADVAELVRIHDVAIVGWDGRALPPGLAEDPGALRYVCCYSGTIRGYVPREMVASGTWVSNWGDLPAGGVAEAAMTHLLAAIHDLGPAIDATRSGRWGFDGSRTGSLEDLSVAVYGIGVIGRRFIEMLRPFGARVTCFDPYVEEVPPGCRRADSLEELCDHADALVIHAGLSDETSGSVTADHLAKLPDGGIVINTARGAIVDQDALFAELESGRLRAGLDVLEPEELASDHPVRQLPNVILTYHQASGGSWPPRPGLTKMQMRVLEQLDRFSAGETPRFLFDLDRYDRST